MATTNETRRSFLAELSWFQVLAGVLAAMTSAWIASALGVAGTIIGAALGSLVVTISSAFYARTLDRGRTLVVQTDRGTVVEHDVAPGETVVAVAAAEEATGGTVQSTSEVDEQRSVRWPLVAGTTVVVLVVALLAMGGYEKLSGSSYGTGGDNARITNPFGGAPAPTATDDPSDSDEPSDDTTPSPSASATTPVPTASSPAPTATRTPTPTRSPTASASPDPTEE